MTTEDVSSKLEQTGRVKGWQTSGIEKTLELPVLADFK
jgi:hypothetical protein